MSNDLVGRRVANFIIDERIGRGGMATVYRAYQPSVNRDVALKVIRLDDATIAGTTFQERFAQEAEVIASLEHIHILPVYDYGISENIAYLAMRLMRGGTLSDALDEGPMPLERIVELFSQIGRGLAYAHSKGVIHRDLKPSNVLLDEEGNAWLTDFGLAKLVMGTADLTQSGKIVGTPAYMSPEQLRGEVLDPRSDVYSMGVILYEMLTGRTPFEDESSDAVAVIYRHLEQPPQPPSEVNPDIPPEVETVVLKALGKAPEARYAGATFMTRALREAIGLSPSSTTDPVLLPARTATPRFRRIGKNALYALVAIALVVVVGAIALFTIITGNGDDAFPTPTVLKGEIGTVTAVIPSQEEIDAARRHVGAGGFIALITCNRTSEYHAGAAREIVEVAREYGLTVRIYDSDNDEYSEITLIEQARADGAAGLIICPLDIGLLHESLTSVDEADLPLVLFTSGEERYGGVVVETDNYLLGLEPGHLAGKIVRDEMDGEADVIILSYPDLPTLERRADGLVDGLLEIAPNANVIGRYVGATRENGRHSVRMALDEGIEFDMILSINDAGSFGAIETLRDAGYGPDDVKIISVDAEALALQYIHNEFFMRGSVAVDRAAVSQAMVDSMVKLLAGDTLPEQILAPPGDVITRQLLQLNGQIER